MSFLYPTYLWALIGLAVPIVIHLWSRKKVKVIKVGSIQFLESLDPKQSNSVRWNELWLLFMRLLLVLLIVLIMAQPRMERTEQNAPITYLVEPSLLTDAGIRSVIDTLPKSSIRLLTTGFPEWNRDDVVGMKDEIPNYWQLAQEMEQLPSDSIIVITPAFLKGIKGMRTTTAANIQWIHFDVGKIKDGILEAYTKDEEVTLLKVTGSPRHLGFKKQLLPMGSDQMKVNPARDSITIIAEQGKIGLLLAKKKPINIHLVYEGQLSDQMKYVASAFRALGSYLNLVVNVRSELISDTTRSENSEYLVWLSEKSIPENVSHVLAYRPDSLAGPLVMPGLKKNIYHLTRLLNVENIVTENLYSRLLPLLDLHPGLQEKILPYDQRVVAINELRPNNSTVTTSQQKAQLLDVSPWFWAILFLLLIGERIVAKYKRQ